MFPAIRFLTAIIQVALSLCGCSCAGDSLFWAPRGQEGDESLTAGPDLKLRLWAERQRCRAPAPHQADRISCAESPSIFTRTN